MGPFDALQPHPGLGEAALLALLEASPDPTWIQTPEGRLLAVNQAACERYGYSREAFLGLRTVDLVAPESLESHHTWTKRLLSQGSGRLACHHLRRDRVVLSVELCASSTATPRGPLILCTARDTTQEAEKDRRLREAQRLSALGALAGGVAHDFNNLIGVILGAAELIDMKIDPQGPLSKKVEIIRQVCGRARDLSTQILNFGRRTDASWAPIDLTDLTTEVANLLQTTLPSNVKVARDLARGVTVLGDPSQLHQVIMNLCINGAQAMQPAGGVLSIKLESVDPDVDHLGRPSARLTVEDSGCGMDQPTLERIFEPFFTTKAAGQGTGLGLSVVRGIIQGHGGDLQVSTQPGQGSSFQILLPTHRERRQRLEAEAPEWRMPQLLEPLRSQGRRGSDEPGSLRHPNGSTGTLDHRPACPAKDRPA